MTSRAARSTSTSSSISSTSSVVALCLIAAGCVCLALGTIGVGFRAAGFGWVAQSIIALVIGFVAMLSGLMMASNDRANALHQPIAGNDLRLVRPNLHAVSVNQNEWNAARPDRVKVHAWRSDQYALPPGRTA